MIILEGWCGGVFTFRYNMALSRLRGIFVEIVNVFDEHYLQIRMHFFLVLRLSIMFVITVRFIVHIHGTVNSTVLCYVNTNSSSSSRYTELYS